MCVWVGDVSSLFCDVVVALIVCVWVGYVSSVFCDVVVALIVCMRVWMLVHCFVM